MVIRLRTCAMAQNDVSTHHRAVACTRLEHTLTWPQSGFLQSDEAFNPIDEPDMMEHDHGGDYDEPELRQVQPARRDKTCPRTAASCL